MSLHLNVPTLNAAEGILWAHQETQHPALSHLCCGELELDELKSSKFYLWSPAYAAQAPNFTEENEDMWLDVNTNFSLS